VVRSDPGRRIQIGRLRRFSRGGSAPMAEGSPASGGARRSSGELQQSRLGGTICGAGSTGAKRGSWRIQLEHLCGRTDDDIGARRGKADGSRQRTPTSSCRRCRARGRERTHEVLPHLHAKLRAVSSSTDRRRRGGSMTVAG
jgi:hypothetical protein